MALTYRFPSITFTLRRVSTSCGWLWICSTLATMDCRKSMSLRHRIMMISSLTLSKNCYWFSGRWEFGTSMPSRFSRSCLFSPVVFLETRISSSISWSLSICRLLISVRIFEAILTCISIFFLLSVIYGSLSIAMVKLELICDISEFYPPPIF